MNRAQAFAANAPLMGVPGAAPPPGGKGDWFRGAGGMRLRAGLWKPSHLAADKVRGTVVLSPGRTEPIEKYYEVIGNFLARGWCVLTHDWRGQGLSARLLPDRLKGHARAVEEFLDDYNRLLNAYEDQCPKPWIMVGHSMGACLNLLSLESGEDRFAGAVLSSPMLRIKTGKRSMWSVKLVVRWNIRHGQAGDYILGDPDDPFDHNFAEDALTSDETRYEMWRQQLYACPHLAIGGPTYGWLAFALDAGELGDVGWLLGPQHVGVATIGASGAAGRVQQHDRRGFGGQGLGQVMRDELPRQAQALQLRDGLSAGRLHGVRHDQHAARLSVPSHGDGRLALALGLGLGCGERGGGGSGQ